MGSAAGGARGKGGLLLFHAVSAASWAFGGAFILGLLSRGGDDDLVDHHAIFTHPDVDLVKTGMGYRELLAADPSVVIAASGERSDGL